ncbi:hypothetical protein [Aeromicrobium sp. NPDC092404]|uniref:hypothetical protein n=1 Tax=Aeromicrobium sp. NPDC092404 TaxID=3154976 RepID=UPI0034153BF2
MTVLAICLIAVGAVVSVLGVLRLVSSRRRVLAPGEVAPGNGIPLMVAGDIALIAGVLVLVL